MNAAFSHRPSKSRLAKQAIYSAARPVEVFLNTDFIRKFNRERHLKNNEKMSAEGAVPARPMKYPYTFAAKIAQFPYAYYFKYNWMVRYHVYAAIVCLPIFYKIGKLSKSPENVAKYNEMRRKQAAEHH